MLSITIFQVSFGQLCNVAWSHLFIILEYSILQQIVIVIVVLSYWDLDKGIT